MLTIRNAREDEAGLLTQIGLRAWAQAMGAIGGSDALQESALSAFSNFVQSSWLTITVIEDNGVVAGWAAREGLDETISDFWIDPDHQRRGLGAALIGEVEKEIVHQGFETARLETHAHNTDAVSFFEKSGYAVNWLSVAYAPKLDQDVQSVGMSKQLVEPQARAYGQEF
ncbi:ribosomal-protein-alanine N-acetyltransferase [Neorhizobium galegae]|uniref:GNAT family N-acetyltransferase n=1 Tax=Neorhizobium galegae TaxID=399 RepID=UPI001AE5E2D9|nr:GNAT family N-acetyltransferase [Neorhizobium galegae]MBP2547197.1 ribosomal-protein-alanine N-acetyltransferase [Neorhizobium galegae]